MTKSAHDEMSEMNINVEETASQYGASRFGQGSSSSDRQRSHQTEFSSKVLNKFLSVNIIVIHLKVETKAMSIGATPPANGDAMTWASEVKESPLPFEKHLTSITNLLNSQYLEEEDFWVKMNVHQVDDLRALFATVLNDYCATLLNDGKLLS